MEITKKLFDKFTIAFSVPVQLYCGQKLVFSCSEMSFSPNPAYFFMQPHIGSKHKVCFVISPDFILSGYISIPETNDYLILGPASPYELSASHIKRLLESMGLARERFDDLLRYFHYLPKMSSTSFCSMLEFINSLISPDSNDEPIHLTYQVPHMIFRDNKDLISDGDMNSNVEHMLRQMITYGRVDELIKYFDQLDITENVDIPDLAPNAIRSLKNTIITTAGISARSAIEGGLDYKTAMTISDYYINKVETLNSFSELREMLRTIMYDFTKRVAISKRPDSDSATINAIYRDVQKYRYVKLTSKDIATHLSLSCSYICHHFKAQTGKTLTEYIHEQKINEAKYLLDTSDLPLVLIAERLGYSSQQQFQQVFKRVTGTSPKRYRNGVKYPSI